MSTLQDELASLKIDRSGSRKGVSRRKDSAPQSAGPRRRGAGGSIRGTVLWLVPLSLLGAGGYYGYVKWREDRYKPEVKIDDVKAMTWGEANKTLSATGYLKSRNQTKIGAKTAGRVQSILFEEGAHVKKGDILAELEHSDIDAQLASRRAQLARAEADVQEAQADLDEKQRRANRTERLALRANVSMEDKEQNDAALKKAAAHLSSMVATAQLQKQMIREMEVNLEYMFIHSPFDGVIVRKDAEVGLMMTANEAVATIANLARMDVETDVNEKLLARVAVGQPAEILVSSVPTKRYRGRLRLVVPMSDRGRGTVKVMVEFLEPDEHLFPELAATVHFLPDKSLSTPDAGKPLLFVSKEAIVEEEGHAYVFLVDSNKIVHKTQVDVVMTNEDFVQVERGPKAGDKVVRTPPKTLRDGEPVQTP